MNKFIILIALTTVSLFTAGQIRYLRYNDDFSFVKSDSLKKTGFQHLKHIPVTDQINLSVGGEVREQLQYYNNINFGDVPRGFNRISSWQLWHRVMSHANIEAGKKTRIFAQLGSTFWFFNPNPLTPEIDQNELSLHQAFVDYHWTKNWMTRIGRQEISYGNHRIITFREGPNTRLTFDGGIMRYNSEKRKADVFVLFPVISNKGVFDDETFKDIITGAYATEVYSKWFSADYYFLYFGSGRRLYNFTGGKERRYSAGFRIFSESQLTNYELEVTYQFGKFNKSDIIAYSLSADVNHILVPEYQFRVGLAGNYISGDKDKNDNQLNTYNLLFSKPNYGLTAPIGATNIITVNPYIKMRPFKKGNVYVATYFMWRQSAQDGTYSPGAIQVRPKPELIFISGKRKIGTLVVLETDYTLSSHLSFAIEASGIFAGNYTKETGKGRNITYLSFKTSYKF